MIKAKAAPDPMLARKIKDKNVIPVISQRLLCDLYLGGYSKMVAAYADYIKYPFEDRQDLMALTKYRSVKGVWDKKWEEFIKNPAPEQLGEEYLYAVKQHLFDLASNDGITPKPLLKEVPDDLDVIGFENLMNLLEYPMFGDEGEDPLLIMADMSLPIYLTTSPHSFIEKAILELGGECESEFCRWREGSRHITSAFDKDGYEPSPGRPLVYHLLGMDRHQDSLVLTEDDYLTFLIEVTKSDQPYSTTRVAQAIAESSLLFLGFNLQSWEFRVLFHGLIKPSAMLKPGKFIVQIDPSEQGEVPTEEEQRYFRNYMRDEAKLEIEWGEIHQYLRELKDLTDQIKY
jgi:hypothetical protein